MEGRQVSGSRNEAVDIPPPPVPPPVLPAEKPFYWELSLFDSEYTDVPQH